MNYDSNRPANVGDTKLSEIALDTAMPLFSGSGPQTNALVTEQVAFQSILENARRQNVMLRSDGISQFTWDGTNLRFDFNSVANTMDLEFLSTESAVYPSFTVQLVGSASANAAQAFQFIPIADGQVVYLELDSTQLAGQPGSPFALYNAINGGGLHVGLRVLVQSISAGMPTLQIGSTGSGSLFYIPLVMRRGTNLMWPLNGQVWAVDTTSAIGQIGSPTSNAPNMGVTPGGAVASTASFSTTSSTPVTITGAGSLPVETAVTLTGNKGICVVMLVPTQGNTGGILINGGSSASEATLQILNGSAIIYSSPMGATTSGTSVQNTRFPLGISCLSLISGVAGDVFTFSAKIASSGGFTTTVTNMQILAYELLS